jgi:diguanylate cyclase (GGDEF)-like protein
MHVRSSDTVARVGGDEFAIILDKCARTFVEGVCQKILQALNPLEIEWQGARYSIGASIGVAMLTREMASEADWMAAADKACYQAKSEGRGQVRIAGP